jgi:17beta-estradiol 17-dehydrogenase / very-long-chain 3-oxoacyl-CoA reductase
MLQSALSVIGLAVGSGYLLHLAYRTFQFINLYFRVPTHPLQKYKLHSAAGAGPPVDGNIKDKTTAWALITGSSGGIGFGYAEYLLSRGFGVVILAHEGIAEAEAALRKEHPQGAIKSFTFDCTTATVSDIEELVRRVEKLAITILINNVGSIPMVPPSFRPFREFDAEGIDNHFNLNARFMTHLTRLMIPVLERNAQPRSLILNTTSLGRFGIPYLSMYCATKAYVTGFSHTLTRECKAFDYPIDCLLIVPGEVVSQGNRIGYPKGAPLAGDYAKIVLERVDTAVTRGLLEISPYWKHALELTGLDWASESRLLSELLHIANRKKDAWAKVQ